MFQLRPRASAHKNMRLEKFQSQGVEPIGEGKDRKVFVNPKDEGKVIAEVRQEIQKETLLQLKGRFYLTKIAHLLLPDHIPDIYQAGEWKDGTQTTDSQRIQHTAGQENLQKARRLGYKTTEESRRVIATEIGIEAQDLNDKLKSIGLGVNIDEDYENYSRDESGKVYYLESFTPWRIGFVRPRELEVLFDELVFKKAIENLEDDKTKTMCHGYLERLLALLEEEIESLR